MLGSFRGLFSNQGLGPDFADIAAWAKGRGHGFKREREGAGFVIDGRLDGKPWRLEWGPPQRRYIEGRELRLRMELGLPADLQMLVMTRPLMELLEKQALEKITESNPTEVGSTAPEETRWLVMFPKIAMTGSKVLRTNFGGVSSLPNEGPAWIGGPLARALERAAGGLLRSSPMMVLMTLRGRAYLRLQMASADETDVAAAVGLFETACTAALRVGKARGEEPPSFASTISSAWQVLDPDKPK